MIEFGTCVTCGNTGGRSIFLGDQPRPHPKGPEDFWDPIPTPKRLDPERANFWYGNTYVAEACFLGSGRPQTLVPFTCAHTIREATTT